MPQLLLWMGHPGLFPCFNGSLLCPGSDLCHRLCHPRDCIWFPCSNHGHPKNLAETLPHPYKEGAHKGSIHILMLNLCLFCIVTIFITLRYFLYDVGICGGGPVWMLHTTEAGPGTRRAPDITEASLKVSEQDWCRTKKKGGKKEEENKLGF